MSWKWYGVKTVFRTSASGKSKIVVPDDLTDATLVEERIVLIRARSFDEAMRKAEADAKVYAKETYLNVYEQPMRRRYLRACDAFELYDEPGQGIEVFSSSEVVSHVISDKDIVNQHLGQPETAVITDKRRKFRNIEFNRGMNADLKKASNS